MGALDCVSAPHLKSTESTEAFPQKIHVSQTSLAETSRDVESPFSKSNSNGEKHSVWWTLSIDIPLLIIVVIVLALFELGVMPQHKAGFFCNDPKLSYAFTGDTVSNGFIVWSFIFLPVIIIFPCELIFLESDYKRSRIHQGIRNTLWLFRCYAYGIFMNLGIVEVMKFTTGSPRPTFFDLCEPDTGKTCNGSEYVSTYQCTSTKYGPWMQADSHHSFPSGHTSLSVYCGMFLAWYLQRRAFDWRHRSVFLVPVLQLCLATYAAVSSFTRITDHRHHWWDVVVGSLVGVVCLLYSALLLCDNFTSKANSSESQQWLYNARSSRNTIA